MTIVIRAEKPSTWGFSLPWCIAYVTSIVGVLNLAELITDIIALACAAGGQWTDYSGAGYVYFATSSACVKATLMLVLSLLALVPSQKPFSIKFLLITTALMVILLFVASIIVSVAAGQYSSVGALGASAFFCFLSTFLWGADTFIQFLEFRGTKFAPSSAPGGTTDQNQPYSGSVVDDGEAGKRY